jgi:hypothetical protein
MWKGQLTTIFGLMLAVGTAVVGGLATGIIPPDFLPQLVKGVFALMMVIGGAGVGYFGKDYNVTGGTVRNPDVPLGKDIGPMILLLLIPLVLLSGCTRLPLSMEAKVDLANTIATAKALKPKCEGGDNSACTTMLAVEQRVIGKLAASIEGSDPNYAGYVGRLASAEYRLEILKADRLASHCRLNCPTDPNFCRNALNLYPVLQRLQAGAAGTN